VWFAGCRTFIYNRFLVELSVNGSLGLRIVLSGTSSAVNGLAVDWAAGNLYWTDGLYRWIAVTRVARRGAAATGHKTLVSMDVEQPYGIAVWPHRGFVSRRDVLFRRVSTLQSIRPRRFFVYS